MVAGAGCEGIVSSRSCSTVLDVTVLFRGGPWGGVRWQHIALADQRLKLNLWRSC